MSLYPHFRLLHRSAPRRTWQLELSIDDSRQSWSIPLGPPERPHARHLALEQAADGESANSIGDCTDAGPAEIRKRTARQITFVLHGAKLRGCFTLIRLPNTNTRQRRWLWVRVVPRARAARSRLAAGTLLS